MISILLTNINTHHQQPPQMQLIDCHWCGKQVQFQAIFKAIKPQIPLRHREPNHISTIGLEMAFYYVLFIALFMASLFIVIRRRGRDHVHIPQNWLVVGMLPSLLLNVHRIHDWVTDALRGGSHSLLFKGPWLSGMVIPVTCNPDDFHYICKTKASRFPRGSEFTERFDILGDGILNTSGDLWRNRRKIAHKLLHTKEFRGFMEMVTRKKVEKMLVPMLKYFAQQGKVVDLQEVLNRFAFDIMCKLVRYIIHVIFFFKSANQV